MASIKDIAREAQVGIGTVSRVLNHSANVSEKTRYRVQTAIERVGYTPNALGRSLKIQRANLVGLALPDITQPIFSHLAAHVSSALADEGYMLFICNTRGQRSREKFFIDMMRQKRIDALIIISGSDLKRCLTADTKVVSIDLNLGENRPCVSSDNYDGAAQATRLMIEKGSRHLGYIGMEIPAETLISQRQSAFEDTCRAMRVPYVCEQFHYMHGQEIGAARKFLHLHPDLDGILAVSDCMALCLDAVLKQQGKRVPADVQIVGFDGVPPEAGVQRLTTVRQDLPAIAQRTTAAVMAIINDAPIDLQAIESPVPVELVIGNTTRP